MIKKKVPNIIMEESLTIKDILFDALIKNSPDAIAITDIEGILIDHSESFLQLFGHDSTKGDTLIGTNGWLLFTPEESDRIENYYEELLKSGSLVSIDTTFLKKDGTPFPAQMSNSIVNDENGEPKYIITTLRDITQQKELERLAIEKQHLLIKSEKRMRSLINSLVNVVVELTIKGRKIIKSRIVKGPFVKKGEC